jgi:catechol 2,3-dioxygenase-like lactoylglutathione lyase family enzyme
MAVSGLDHVAIPTEKTEELIAFYKRLGFAVVDEERWRAGQAPRSVVHPKRYWWRIRNEARTGS